ncbi:Sphingosine kinase 2 [Perkinsus chesapeaki]|uniref:Sphingosine kinase 2 n=1 Tax=Perkinsus chesapeaki TaxID=330153 RepID=A0A7J6L6F4_PERCH|nr:Sphingosine kinase 2 [Perkinsus chesapeaki]
MDSSDSSRAPSHPPRNRPAPPVASKTIPPRKAPPKLPAHNKTVHKEEKHPSNGRITYCQGQQVQVFICQVPENDFDPDMGWMMVGSRVEGQVSPRLGMTDGWVDATVVSDFDRSKYRADMRETWPVVEYCHSLWADGRGAMLDGSKLYNLRQSVKPERIRLPAEGRRPPSLSLLIVRYGDGARRVDTRFDMAVTDELITDLIRDGIYATYGTDYECWCAFVRHTSDLPRISEAWARTALTKSGCSNLGAMYFLWGAVHGDHKPGYVEYSVLFDLMQRMECVGIPTRWPNPVSLYRVLSSKSWQASLATNTALRIPPTTTIQRADFMQDPSGTCRRAVRALQLQANALWGGTDSLSVYSERGVVKIGYSWMAEGVKAFYGIGDMERKTRALWESLPNNESTLMVQHRIEDIVTEPRVFIYDGKIEHIRYTEYVNEETSSGRFRQFRTFSSRDATYRYFDGNHDVRLAIEERMKEMVEKWLLWITTAMGCTVPCFVRIDFLVAKAKEGSKTAIRVERAKGSEKTAECEINNGGSDSEEAESGDTDEWYADDSSSGSSTPSSYASACSEGEEEEEETFHGEVGYEVWTGEVGEIGSSMVGYRGGRQRFFECMAKSCLPDVGSTLRPVDLPPV